MRASPGSTVALSVPTPPFRYHRRRRRSGRGRHRQPDRRGRPARRLRPACRCHRRRSGCHHQDRHADGSRWMVALGQEDGRRPNRHLRSRPLSGSCRPRPRARRWRPRSRSPLADPCASRSRRWSVPTSPSTTSAPSATAPCRKISSPGPPLSVSPPPRPMRTSFPARPSSTFGSALPVKAVGKGGPGQVLDPHEGVAALTCRRVSGQVRRHTGSRRAVRDQVDTVLAPQLVVARSTDEHVVTDPPVEEVVSRAARRSCHRRRSCHHHRRCRRGCRYRPAPRTVSASGPARTKSLPFPALISSSPGL